MSRIGIRPVAIPAGARVSTKDGLVAVEGPRGKLELAVPPVLRVEVTRGPDAVKVVRHGETSGEKALHGTIRQLIANMIVGVTQGHTKSLDIVGLGYQAKVQGADLVLQIGLSHPVKKAIPATLKVSCPSPTKIVIEGADKAEVGEYAAQVRSLKPPEPYNQTGIRYSGEMMRKKAGKTFVSGAS